MVVEVETKKENNKKRESRCIMCGEAKDGLEVNEDFVIYIMRWFKRNITKNEKNYRLVVCKACYSKYYEERKKYEKRQALYLVLGILFAIILIIIGQNKLIALLYGLIIILFVYLLSLLTYIPSVKIPQSVNVNTIKTTKSKSKKE
ncbi:MAG: hypothetical protein ACP5UN_01025 [Candidatus Micrarchaeia archaeon]